MDFVIYTTYGMELMFWWMWDLFFTETQRHRMLYIYLKSIQVHESNEPTTTAQWNNSIQDTVRTTTLTPYNICIMSLKPMYIARVVIYFYIRTFQFRVQHYGFVFPPISLDYLFYAIPKNAILMEMKLIRVSIWKLWNLSRLICMEIWETHWCWTKFIANHRMQYTMIAYD